MESVLEKIKVAQTNTFVKNNLYTQQGITASKPVMLSRKKTVLPVEKISLKQDWMKFINNTMAAMYSKISH